MIFKVSFLIVTHSEVLCVANYINFLEFFFRKESFEIDLLNIISAPEGVLISSRLFLPLPLNPVCRFFPSILFTKKKNLIF